MKRLLVILFLLVALSISAAVVAGFVFIDSLAKQAIERGGTAALGVKTTLGSADVGVLSGRFALSGLNIDNPPGFKAPAFFSLGSGAVAVSYSTLQEPTVVLPELTLSTIRVWLERSSGATNYGAILDNLKKFQGTPSGGSGAGAGSGSGSGSETKFVISELVIRDVSVSIDMAGFPGPAGEIVNKAASLSIPVEEIRLQNVGQTGSGVGGTGVTMGELTGIVLQAVLGAVQDKAGGALPPFLTQDLGLALSGLRSLKDLGIESVVKIADPGALKELVEGQLGQAVQGIQDAAAGAAKQATEGLGNAVKDALPKGLPIPELPVPKLPEAPKLPSLPGLPGPKPEEPKPPQA
ncbi:MAG: hypothetical protein C0475_03930 [Planctomyces sp.]|nr:hypothetical protein [Planctomyces sp.]